MKSYGQYCPIAHALGLVGERWSLLIVRDLLDGPRRYTDLTDSLPGISTNMLAARLTELEANGVVEKRKLPPPAASTVYELTEFGRGLKPALDALALWGVRSLGPPSEDASIAPGWLRHALELTVAPCARGARLAFRVGAEEASVVDGVAVEGLVDDAEALVEGDAKGFYALVIEGDPSRVTVAGDASFLARIAGERLLPRH
jgi:DNA-binding HxlR family transcriptional regulator